MTAIRRSTFVLVALSASTPAFADGETATGAAPAETGETFVARRFVASESKIRAYAGYGIGGETETNMMMSTTSLRDRADIGAGYGVTNELTLGGQFDFAPGFGDDDFEILGTLTLFGMMELVNDGTLNITPTASFGYDLCHGHDTAGDCTTSMGLALGAGFKYRVTPEIALFSGSPVGPGPIGQHLKISLDDKGPITLDVPAGGIYQATSELAVYLATNIAHIGISNDNSQAFFGADFIPIEVGAAFELSPTLELEAAIETKDVQAIDDDYRLFFGIRLDM